jgi:hypothetical protein
MKIPNEQGKEVVIDTFQENRDGSISGTVNLKKDIVEKFKDTIIDMHRGIPQFYYYGYLEKLIPNKEIRDYFFKKDVFVKSKTKGANNQDQYFLGVNGIILANNYKSEIIAEETRRLTKTMKRLTWVIAILTLIMVGIAVF